MVEVSTDSARVAPSCFPIAKFSSAWHTASYGRASNFSQPNCSAAFYQAPSNLHYPTNILETFSLNQLRTVAVQKLVLTGYTTMTKKSKKVQEPSPPGDTEYLAILCDTVNVRGDADEVGDLCQQNLSALAPTASATYESGPPRWGNPAGLTILEGLDDLRRKVEGLITENLRTNVGIYTSKEFKKIS